MEIALQSSRRSAGSKFFTNKNYADNLGRTTSYQREDGSGAIARITHPDGTFETTTHNSFAQPLVQTDRLGRQTVYAYDAHGNLLTKTVAAGTAGQAVYTWGSVRQVAHI